MHARRLATPRDAIGAYGLRLANVERARPLLVAAPPQWPELEIRRRRGSDRAEHDLLSDAHATIRLRRGQILVDRARRRATFVLPRPVTTSELVHPLLAPVGAVMSYWLGRASFHAGAFVLGGRAWGVLGPRGSGKSTTLARLALEDVPVLADDLLVIEGGCVFAGPRSLDLRRQAATRLGVGEGLGVVGARERWRLRLPEGPPKVELAGWVFLTWGSAAEVVRVTGGERLVRLQANLAVNVPPRDPEQLLDLAALPGWELRRPRGWRSLDDTVQRLLATLG